MDLSNENVVHIKSKDMEYLQFRKLLKYNDIIAHGYSLGIDKNFRTAKASKENLSKEEFEKAVKSYKTFCQKLGIKYNNIVKTNQKHTDNVEIIETKNKLGEPDFEAFKNTDGFITKTRDIALSTTNADCILIMFFDLEKKIIANVHSGWKGTLKRISVKAVEKMQKEYGCKPENIIACMCPSIRKCHFEVERDVCELFYNEFQDLDNLENIIEKKGEKWYIDTIMINETILLRAGLIKENIIDSGICSVCNKEIVHSFRAEGIGYGLNTAIITLK